MNIPELSEWGLHDIANAQHDRHLHMSDFPACTRDSLILHTRRRTVAEEQCSQAPRPGLPTLASIPGPTCPRRRSGDLGTAYGSS